MQSEHNVLLKKMSPWLAGSPWFVVVCALALTMFVVVYNFRNAKRESDFTRQLMLEKGEALLFALEGALQTGDDFQWVDEALLDFLQRMGAQKNLRYLGIADGADLTQQISFPEGGEPVRLGIAALKDLEPSAKTQDTVYQVPAGPSLLLVYKSIAIEHRKHRMMHTHGARGYRGPRITHKLLLVGYDMAPLAEAQASDKRHSVILVAILLFIALVGVFSLYLVRSYRLSRQRVEEANGLLLRQERLAALGAMAAGVAHEVRNPLSSISGAARIIEEANPVDSEEHTLARVIRQEVTRLDKVVGDLLDVSRQDSVHVSLVAVQACVGRAQRLMQGEMEAKNISFVSQVLPEDLTAFFDLDRITQVLLNLFLNAVQSMPDGGTLTVTARLEIKIASGKKIAPGKKIALGKRLAPGMSNVSTRGVDANAQGGSNDVLILQVLDTGLGMTLEAQQRIFSPYFTTKAKGTGLGLSIVHKIIEAHGGTIHVSSRPGAGSAFTIRLPQGRGESQ